MLIEYRAEHCTFHAVLPGLPHLERVLRPEVSLAALGPLVLRVPVVHDAVTGATCDNSTIYLQ